jgi:hypothetical protein
MVLDFVLPFDNSADFLADTGEKLSFSAREQMPNLKIQDYCRYLYILSDIGKQRAHTVKQGAFCPSKNS